MLLLQSLDERREYQGSEVVRHYFPLVPQDNPFGRVRGFHYFTLRYCC